MGRRSRVKGVTNAALRAARAAQMTQDAEAQEIAKAVYGVAVSTRGQTEFPLRVYAPVQTAAELAALGIVRAYDLAPRDTELEQAAAREVAAYMVSGFFAMIAEFNVEHWGEWRRNHGGREPDGDSRAGTTAHEGAPTRE